jgi:hypothetical protein
MAKTQERDNETPAGNTADYSATKAPENREHIESKQPGTDVGSHRAVQVGMEALHRETVPSMAADLGLTDDGSNPAKERVGTGRD